MAQNRDFSSFGEDDWKRQEAADDASLNRILGETQQSGEAAFNIDDTPFDQSGKADDAQDFEDISDDELPEEEDAHGAASNEVPGLTDDGGTSNDTDDLFGDGEVSSPVETPGDALQVSPHPHVVDPDNPDASLPTAGDSAIDFRNINFPEHANQDPDIPSAPESREEIVKKVWPTFEKGVICNFNELLPPRKAYVDPKKPPPPSALKLTKLSLDLDVDQEKTFRIPSASTTVLRKKIQETEAKGLLSCLKLKPVEEADVEIFKEDMDADPDEKVGGFTLQDIDLICTDFESTIDPPFFGVLEEQKATAAAAAAEDEEMDDWDREFLAMEPPAKKRKVTVQPGLPMVPRLTAPSFDTFEQATARSAKRVRLDLNDPFLLLDEAVSERAAKRPKIAQTTKRMANGKFGIDVTQRYNISNDEAYDALKENHQNKIRATHGNLKVEHSLPALKCVWPYYQVKIAADPFTYHRPAMKTRTGMTTTGIRFAKPRHFRKKEFRGRKVQDIFSSSRDLGLNDNSTAVLFEYCEEIPTVLSNFGMGCRVINYHRRKGGSEDEQVPKQKNDIGEAHILLPEDKSPFSIFGSVDAGETVPTLHNEMYRAPIFKHAPRSTDFLCGRSHTGEGGSSYYLRNIDHIFVVGQNLPSMEVPGPHSRRVTNASKNRLKMIAIRLSHSHGGAAPQASLNMHSALDPKDNTLRQKLKEYMDYHKDSRVWTLKNPAELVDEAQIRAMVKPEEICLLDAMQVGSAELEKSGYEFTDRDLDNDDDRDDKDASLASKMVPWKTTKNFIDACAGKAMLQLHGEGDPTGRGLGLNFIKTSMKGGYIGAVQGPAATSADAIERERKANGGHSYNVKKQEQMYQRAINEIWDLQKGSLSDPTEHDDGDVQPQEDEDDRFNFHEPGATPAAPRDEGMSQISRSATSAFRRDKKKLRIWRTYRKPDGTIEEREEIVTDPGVIAQYVKQRLVQEDESFDPYNAKPTGNPEIDRLIASKIAKETSRLERNKERRTMREKQKQLLRGNPDDPDAPVSSIEKSGTTRKCANCGQIGHIKTNKKLCPRLNGTWKADNGADEHGGFGDYQAASSSTPAP